jgi:hypothetical protein
MEPTPKANSTPSHRLLIADALESPRVLKFPAQPASPPPAPPPAVESADTEADTPAVICDLGAYRRMTQRIDRELDRMQARLDQLRRDADDEGSGYRFPAPDDDSPRPAA